MDLTESYQKVIPAATIARYDWCEVRNAAGILAAANPDEFADLLAVLEAFKVEVARDITPPGGNESLTAAALNSAFRHRGWREGSFNMRIISKLTMLAFVVDGVVISPADEKETTISSPSYLVDNVKGRVALDVEWHAKDGNLDRDIAAYRSLYDAGIIDGAVMVTMTRESMRAWALRLDAESRKFATSTTTNLTKVRPKLERGDGGGCPILIASICERTI